jgi:hypothetical protein
MHDPFRAPSIPVCFTRRRGGPCTMAGCETADVKQQMRNWAILASLVLLGACQPSPASDPVPDDLSAGVVRLDGTRPPDGPQGTCWDRDVLPTVIETVTEQVLVQPETFAADGTIRTAAVFRTETSQRIVQERGQVWFRAPCLADLDVDFVATLQRALKARGIYMLPVNGIYDAATAGAVRRIKHRAALTAAACHWPLRANWALLRPTSGWHPQNEIGAADCSATPISSF